MLRLLIGIFFALMFAAGDAVAETRIALVIANSNYSGALGGLANPINDGKLVAQSLEVAGFKVALVMDADQRTMKRAIADFGDELSRAAPDATGLFYFAGHGIQVGGVNYLVPVGAAINREADVDLESVAAEAVLKQMEFAGANINIVILDACRNNPLARSLRSAGQGLARMDAPKGSFVAYSTAPGSVAADGTGANSPFASALATEILKPGQSIEATFRNVRTSVLSATRDQQVPWDSSSLTASFYFVEEAAVDPAQSSLAGNAASGDQSAAELAYWTSIQNTTDPAEIEAFLRKFPNGTFSEIAQLKLSKLKVSGQQGTTQTAQRGTGGHDYADAEMIWLPAELRLPREVIKSLRTAEAFQTLQSPRLVRAETKYEYADGGQTQTDIYEVKTIVDGLAIAARESSAVGSWNGVPGASRTTNHDSLVMAGPVALGFESYGKTEHDGTAEEAYAMAKAFDIKGVDGSLFPIEVGRSMSITYDWGRTRADAFERRDDILVTEQVECAELLPTISGRCFKVRVDTELSINNSHSFLNLVFVEDLGVFLQSGEFGAGETVLGMATITKLDPL